MQRRLARMTSSANSSGRVAPTPSPHSTDDLLPTLEEDKQVKVARFRRFRLNRSQSGVLLQKESSWIAIVSDEFDNPLYTYCS